MPGRTSPPRPQLPPPAGRRARRACLLSQPRPSVCASPIPSLHLLFFVPSSSPVLAFLPSVPSRSPRLRPSLRTCCAGLACSPSPGASAGHPVPKFTPERQRPGPRCSRVSARTPCPCPAGRWARARLSLPAWAGRVTGPAPAAGGRDGLVSSLREPRAGRSCFEAPRRGPRAGRGWAQAGSRGSRAPRPAPGSQHGRAPAPL